MQEDTNQYDELRTILAAEILAWSNRNRTTATGFLDGNHGISELEKPAHDDILLAINKEIPYVLANGGTLEEISAPGEVNKKLDTLMSGPPSDEMPLGGATGADIKHPVSLPAEESKQNIAVNSPPGVKRKNPFPDPRDSPSSNLEDEAAASATPPPPPSAP
jgi:hypothetical protein